MSIPPTAADVERLIGETEALRAQLHAKCEELKEALNALCRDPGDEAAAQIVTVRKALDRRKQEA